MVRFEEAARMLDEEADALPPELYKDLNGGISLLPEERRSPDGLFTMGMYIRDAMGRRVELYYGSFLALYQNLSPEALRRKLRHTLHHELTHHLESLAGDRSLERWDEDHRAALLEQLHSETVYIDSLLFVDGDGVSLAPMAEAMLRFELQRRGDDMPCAAAGLSLAPGAGVPEPAVRAARQYGADISAYAPQPVTRALLEQYDAVLCMTEAQADELAGRFPDFDGKIFALGERDILSPRRNSDAAWERAAGKLYAEIADFLDELDGGGYDDEV